MKKIVLFLILLVQMSWSQTPIYQWNFNSSLDDSTNTFSFTSSPNVAGYYTADRFGNANSAYATPQGTNVQLSVSGLSNLPQGSNARTISVWMKFNASYTSDIGIFEYGTQANSQVCGLTQQGNSQSVPNSLKAYGYSNDFTSPSNSAAFNFATTNTEWYHYVLTYDIGMLRVYRNGNLLIEQNNATWNTQGTTLRLLSNIATFLGGTNYNVNIDDLKIYNTVLSQTQINQMYQTEFPVSNTNLISYFPFSNSYNATIGNYAFAPVNSGSLSYVTGANGQGVNIGNSNALANGGGYGSGDLANALSNQNLTVSFWMKRNANATNAYETASELFGSMYFRDRPSSINISLRRETGVATGTNGANASFFSNSSYFNENLLNKWIHVAQVFFTEGGLRYFAVYINGELKNAGLVSSNPIYKYNSVVSLGGGTDAGGNFMLSKYANIAIDEVMYFNRALSFPEILSLRYYEPSNTPPPCPTGDVTLTTQAEVDALASCTSINGNLTINGGGNSLDFSPLNGITSISGNLQITGVSSNVSNFLPNLTSIGGHIRVLSNSFTSFGGFSSLTTVNNEIAFRYNTTLTTISGFGNITNINSFLIFDGNTNLSSINAFGNLNTVDGFLLYDSKLQNLNFLSSLTLNKGFLSVQANPLLTSVFFPNMVIHNFTNNFPGGKYFYISENPILTSVGNIDFNGSSTCENFMFRNNPLLNAVNNLSTSNFSVIYGVRIQNNPQLPNLNFLQNLVSCDGLFLRELSSITNLNGLSNLTQPALSNWVEIINNSSLVSLNGLSASNINFNNRHLILDNNNALNDISSLSGIQLNNINGLTITNNGQLATCASTWLCDYIATGKPLTVSGNATGCESVSVINTICTNPCPTGNVTLTTQAEVDALASCTTITGNLTISGGGNALDLSPLSNISSITGNLFITSVSNNQVNIFPNLTTVGNGIAIQNNTFQQFSGFNSFTTLTAGTLQFLNNSQLQTISGFNSLISLTSGGNLGFVGNSNLETINAFSNLQTINGLLIRNTKLTNINFMTSLNTNNGQLSIESNPLLTNATFPNMVNHNFSNGTTGVRYIRFINNILLTSIGNINFNGSSNCESLLIQSSPLLDTITNLNSTSNFYVVGIVQITGTALQNLSFLQGLTECIGLTLSNNSSLQNLNGLSNLTGIGGNVNISNNPQLSNLNGLNTTSINLYNNSVTINNCANLNNINALSVIPVSSISSLTITNNSQLATCASTWLCDYAATGKPLTITGNATGCESVAAINTACAALSNSDFNLAEVSLFPNPTDAIFSIEVPNEVVKQVRIFDVTGKMLLDSNQSTFNVSAFSSGIYMVNIVTESGKTGVSKLVKK